MLNIVLIGILFLLVFVYFNMSPSEQYQEPSENKECMSCKEGLKVFRTERDAGNSGDNGNRDGPTGSTGPSEGDRNSTGDRDGDNNSTGDRDSTNRPTPKAKKSMRKSETRKYACPLVSSSSLNPEGNTNSTCNAMKDICSQCKGCFYKFPDA